MTVIREITYVDTPDEAWAAVHQHYLNGTLATPAEQAVLNRLSGGRIEIRINVLDHPPGLVDDLAAGRDPMAAVLAAARRVAARIGRALRRVWAISAVRVAAGIVGTMVALFLTGHLLYLWLFDEITAGLILLAKAIGGILLTLAILLGIHTATSRDDRG